MKTPHGDNRQVIFINRNSLSNIEAVKHKTATGEQKLRGDESMRSGGQGQEKLETGDQSEGKCWKVLHKAEEQSGSEKWENGAL